MRHLFTILAALFLCSAPLHAQTLKSLMFNATNGQLVAGTNVVWTNAFNFSTNTVANQVRTNLGLGWSALTNSNASASLLGVTTNGQVAANTGTNVLTFTNNSVTFENIVVGGLYNGTNLVYELDSGQFAKPILIEEPYIAETRTNLGIPLAALTNTSNVTAMRALSGSTNTNEPYSGTVALTNTNVLTFSNGVLLKIQ